MSAKPHYEILDGLRGVAALIVVVYHIFESFATSQSDQIVNHGYLAVDFFFMLSGFVVGYAYDDRKITVWEFVKRRLIRLHPMVIMGAAIGAAAFYFSGAEFWPVWSVGVWALLGAMLMNMLMIPARPGVEVRGGGEMFPLNGPNWSLMFEYIGNVLYILFLRRLTTRWLTIFVILMGLGLGAFAIFGPLGSIGAGWQLTTPQFTGGSLRLLFSFSAGLLISRGFKPLRIKGAFWKCSLILLILLALPRVGGFSINGLYETICVVAIFPLLVRMGASGVGGGRVIKFLGELSYPLYMVHYPLLYCYFAWVKNNNLTFIDSIWGALALIFGSILLAWLSLKFYDTPLRKYLTKKLKI